MKRGDIDTDVMLRNQYTLKSSDMTFTIITTSDFEQEWKVVDLPDGNSVPSKRSEPFEFDFEIPAHHTTEVIYVEDWIAKLEASGSPEMKDLTLVMPTSSGAMQYIITLENCFPRKSSMSGQDAQSDEEANFKATMRCSSRSKPQ